MRYLLIWLSDDLKAVQTEIGEYKTLSQKANELKHDKKVILVEIYELKAVQTIKNEVANYFLSKHK